jgi:hypothetical protein
VYFLATAPSFGMFLGLDSWANHQEMETRKKTGEIRIGIFGDLMVLWWAYDLTGFYRVWFTGVFA